MFGASSSELASVMEFGFMFADIVRLTNACIIIIEECHTVFHRI